MHEPEVNHFEVDPFDTVESYFKNKQITVLDYLIQDLNTRMNERKSVKVASELEELLIEGMRGNYGKCQSLMNGEGCEHCESVIDSDILISEFRHINMIIDHNNAISLATLVAELKKQDMGNLWIVAKNHMNLVKILLTLMPTSMSAERSFSALARVKTKLRNSMCDERMNDLVTLAFCPGMVASIDLISLCNKFVAATHLTSTRERLFGKFVPSDLIGKKVAFGSVEDAPIANQARQVMAEETLPPLQELSTLNSTAV